MFDLKTSSPLSLFPETLRSSAAISKPKFGVQKNTLFRTELKLAVIVWAKVWPTRTPKHLKKCIVRLLMQEDLNGSLHIKNTCRESIYAKTRSGEGITPKPKRNGRVCTCVLAELDQSQ